MSTSALQRLTSEKLSVHFGAFTIRENYRPDWLIGPKGERLELDFLIEELKVAIEVQGQQHFVFTEFFHLDHNGFINRIERDRAKKIICNERGIELYEVSNEFELSELIKLITPNKRDIPFIPTKSIPELHASNKMAKSVEKRLRQVDRHIHQTQSFLKGEFKHPHRRQERIDRLSKKLESLIRLRESIK